MRQDQRLTEWKRRGALVMSEGLVGTCRVESVIFLAESARDGRYELI